MRIKQRLHLGFTDFSDFKGVEESNIYLTKFYNDYLKGKTDI